MTDAAQIMALLQTQMFAGFVVFLRLGSAMAVLPVFGESSVPPRVRLALAIAFTLVVLPAVAPNLARPPQNSALIALLGLEVVVGLALGLVIRIFVLALSMAGSIAAQATSLAAAFGGTAQEPMPAIGHLLTMGGLALAALYGLHVKLTELFLLSYSDFPTGLWPSPAGLRDWGVSEIARAFSLAFSLAAPFALAATLYNVALGVINRAMPHLMVSFIGAPALTIGGLILMLIAVPTGLAVWHDGFAAFLADPYEATQ